MTAVRRGTRLSPNQLFVMAIIITFGIVMLTAIAHFWQKMDLSQTEPTFQIILVAFGLFICLVFAERFLRRRF